VPKSAESKLQYKQLPELTHDSSGSDSEAADEPKETSAEKSKLERVSDQRNLQRIETRARNDEKILGKYLPDDIDGYLPGTLMGPDDTFEAPAWLYQAILEVANEPVPVPAKPPVRFDTSNESIEHNSKLLQTFDYNLDKLLAANSHTTLGYGAEFRPINQLEKVLGPHPNFAFLRTVLHNGMDYFFKSQLTEDQRKAELHANVERGNHKSADASADKVRQLLDKDVRHGFSLPVRTELVYKIPKALVQPCGVVTQYALTASGERQLKERLTQDLTYSLTEEEISVNDRIEMSRYPEMIYGWCLLRIIHFVVALRLRHPQKRIFLAKYDFSDAYRRIAHSASAVIQSIIIFAGIAFLALRLTFGGAPNPPTWCCFSEMVTDLSNEIPLCRDWDPTVVFNPEQPDTPMPDEEPGDDPLAPAQPLAVHIPTEITARTDCFIDDLIRAFLDTPDNRRREPHAVPLAIHITTRPHAGDQEPVPRRSLVQAEKMIAEGTPAESQIVLGWILNTHFLLIRLPGDKFVAWSSDIASVLETGSATFGDLESLLGRLNHAGYVIPMARHFLNRLRLRIEHRLHKRQRLTLNHEELEDLRLWLHFLASAHRGISFNQMTIRKPSRLGFSDSCPFGLGGFSHTGRAWRLLIPPDCAFYGESEINNLLEFLAMVVTIWLIIIECAEEGSSEDCILALGDNTSGIGWLFRSGKIKPQSVYYTAVQLIARKLATLVLESSHCLASQHLKGSKNTVSDLLSYTGATREAPHPLAPDNPSDAELTHRFHRYLPQLIPQHFEISPLPSEILSFFILALRTAELSWIRVKRNPTSPGTASGAVGSVSAPKPASITPTSVTYQSPNKNSSFELSSASTESLTGISQADFVANVRDPWWQALCALPQATWLRRSGTISNAAPFTSRTEPSSSHR
jgi:hypothetical protein